MDMHGYIWIRMNDQMMPNFVVLLVLLINVSETGNALPLTTVVLESGECEEGMFPCGNTTQCLPQQYWCNQQSDCPGGEDELFSTCKYKGGFYGAFAEKNEVAPRNTTKYDHCDLAHIPDACSCVRATHLVCSEAALRQPPPDLASNVTKLFIRNNRINVLKRGVFAGLSQLSTLNLGNGSIHRIEPNAFEGMMSLRNLILEYNELTYLEAGTFRNLPNLAWVSLQNNSIRGMDELAFENLPNLYWLNLHQNKFEWNSEKALPFPPSVMWIDLDDNLLTNIYASTFANLTSTTILLLGYNQIRSIATGAFDSMIELEELDLSHNMLQTLHEDALRYTRNLNKLSMSHNPLHTLPLHIFATVPLLGELDLEGFVIDNISPVLFEKLQNLDHIKFIAFGYCRYAPRVRNCSPKSDGISSIDNLLDRHVLRVCIWLVAIVTCTGNVLVFVGRLCLRAEEHKTHSFFIKNLCMADLLTGLYLVIVASHDVVYRDRYNQYAYQWLSSVGCQVTGFIAMMSSEVSLLLLSYMSVERFLTIVYPYKTSRLCFKTSVATVICLWILGFVLAGIPLTSQHAFGAFYGTNGLCFPLHIHEPYMKGWEYSSFVFLFVNFSAIVTITFCYAAMLRSILETRKHVPNLKKGDMAFAKRFLLIVATDAMCWFPIVIIKIMALANLKISNEIYGWVAVFILPVNSALNPVLYSLSSELFRRKLSHVAKRRWKGRTTKSTTNTSGSGSNQYKTMETTVISKYTEVTVEDIAMLPPSSSHLGQLQNTDRASPDMDGRTSPDVEGVNEKTVMM